MVRGYGSLAAADGSARAGPLRTRRGDTSPLGGQLTRQLDFTVDVARVQHAHAVDFKSRPVPLRSGDRQLTIAPLTSILQQIFR